MMHQKCSDPEKFCDACNGFGIIARLPNIGGAAEVDAMIAAGLGDRPIEVVHTDCPECKGSGKRLHFPTRQLN